MSAFARNPGQQTKARAGVAPRRPLEYRVPEARAGAIEWDDGPGLHPTAVIHPDARIDESARVGPYCIVGPNVRIGPRTNLHSHVVVQRDTSLGADNQVFPFAALGLDPQDLKYRGEPTTLEIGDRNVIREHATLHRGTGIGGGFTRLGSDCLIMVGAHIAHDCEVHDHVILANHALLGGHVVVESGATLAGAAAAHHFVTIGRFAFVGGLARITKDVPPFLVTEGSPAEPRKVNTIALTRRGWEAKDVDALKSAFKSLFRSSRGSRRSVEADASLSDRTSETGTRDASPGSVVQTIARLRAETGQSEAVLELCEFLERMQAGVHGRWRETLRERANAQPRRS